MASIPPDIDHGHRLVQSDVRHLELELLAYAAHDTRLLRIEQLAHHFLRHPLIALVAYFLALVVLKVVSLLLAVELSHSALVLLLRELLLLLIELELHFQQTASLLLLRELSCLLHPPHPH